MTSVICPIQLVLDCWNVLNGNIASQEIYQQCYRDVLDKKNRTCKCRVIKMKVVMSDPIR